MGTFESFKQGVANIRKEVEGFKAGHKMASKAISVAIDSCPEPFNKFLSIVWDGLEKKDDSSTMISSVNLLEIVEKIEKNEESFEQIKEKLSELIKSAATKEDIREIGERIRTSNEIIAKMIIDEVIIRLSLLKSNFRLFTALTKFNEFDKNCWRYAHFTEREVRNGYDARRPVTEDIINSVKKAAGTMLYGESGSGKSMLLKRIMFEEIDNNGYTIVFGDDVKANESEIINLLEELLKKFNKLLVIVDNLQKSASAKSLFKVFNNFSEYNNNNNNDDDIKHIRFLFAAREKQLKNVVESDPDINREFNYAQNHLEKLVINFSIDDAKLFLKKAIGISQRQVSLSQEDIAILAENLYNNSNHDLLIFVFAIMYYIAEEKTTAINFIKVDLDEKKIALDKNKELWRPALLCSFMGMLGLKFNEKILENCNVSKSLFSLTEIGFLVDVGQDTFWIRHERWAQKFLVLIYKERKPFFEISYDISDIISCILNNIGINDLLDILYVCRSLHQIEKEYFRPIIYIVIKNFQIPSHLTADEKADLYCFGFGNYFDSIGEKKVAIDYFDKAIDQNSNHSFALTNKGVVLDKLEKYN